MATTGWTHETHPEIAQLFATFYRLEEAEQSFDEMDPMAYFNTPYQPETQAAFDAYRAACAAADVLPERAE